MDFTMTLISGGQKLRGESFPAGTKVQYQGEEYSVFGVDEQRFRVKLKKGNTVVLAHPREVHKF